MKTMRFRKREIQKYNWGVFKRDCYQMSQAEKEAMFIRSFDDYGKALKFAQSYSDKTAIHLTHRR